MEEPISKSQKKREADALQKLGTLLIDWRLDRLDQLPLSDRVRRAILDAKKLNSHGAIRRQSQLIGKLMRSEDHELIITEYNRLLAEDSAQTQCFHEVEQWRENLMDGGNESLTAFVDTYHPDDLQKLRQLIHKAKQDRAKNINLGAAKALFRYLREIM